MVEYLIGISLLTRTPRCITATRRHSFRTTFRLWGDKQHGHAALPVQFFQHFQNLGLNGHISAVVGSSSSSNLGRFTIAAAIIARWSIPPESSWGYLSQIPSGSGSSAAAIAASAR